MVTITYENGALAVRSPYYQLLVSSIKSLPVADRRYDAARKIWLVDPKHANDIANWVLLSAGEVVQLPFIPKAGRQTTTRVLDVRYIGACKHRDDGTVSAFGLSGGAWSVIFPSDILQKWFNGGFDEPPVAPNTKQNLYQILGVGQLSSAEEVKVGYRRLAKQWHPDVCKEQNAADIFRRIQQAYETLGNQEKRDRYDVGLHFEALSSIEPEPEPVPILYRSPLRCGYIMAQGEQKLAGFVVSKIMAWEDITNMEGKTLVVSWPTGANEPIEMWV